MATTQGQVGLQILATGATVTTRLDRTGATVVNDGNARYVEAVSQGNVYVASNQAGTALSTALSATQTGFTLTNPAGSNKVLYPIDACIALTTAPAGVSTLVWAANVNTVATAVTQTTPLTVRNANLGLASTAVGLAASAVTLPAAPVVVRPVGGGPVATGSVTSAFIRDEMAGVGALQPGTALSLSCLTTAISVICGLTWLELPL